MAHGHGGARPGAGRKPNSEKYEAALESFHDQAAGDLGDRYAVLRQLADGGWEQVTTVWEPAATIFVEVPLRGADGQPKVDANGRPIIVRERAYPDREPDELICVRKTVRVAAPDRAANEYLVDRVAGKPVQATEISGPVGGPLQVEVLTDDERAARAAALLDAARARRAGLPADAGPDDAPAAS